MKVCILAGGFGTRLRPLTCNIPKPLASIANKPIMEHVIELLKKHNLNDLIVILYHQPETIIEYFRDGIDLNVKITYVRADRDLGTAGSVKNASGFLGETFLIISADVLTDINLTKVIEFHKNKKSLATIVLTRVENPLSYGVVITDENSRITKFLEKPSWGEVFSDTINTGIYCFEPEVLNYIPEDNEFDFSKGLFPILLNKKLPLYGYITKGYWKDIGNISEYKQAQLDFLHGKTKGIAEKKPKAEGLAEVSQRKKISIGKETKVDSKADLKEPVIIGNNCDIKCNAEISDSIIGDNCVIKEGANIKGSILWDNVYVSEDAKLTDCIVCKGTEIGAKAILESGAVISDNCFIGKESIIKSEVKIWPYKIVENGAILSTSLIWGDKWSRTLFTEYGVVGLANIEITPEFATKLGAAYGATLVKGSLVISSRDSHKTSRMLHRAIMCGLLSSGVNVQDAGTVPIPLARHVTKPLGGAGGIHIRRSPYDPQLIDMKFFDENGMDLSTSKEKSIEGLFFREDFRRAHIEETGELSYPYRAIEFYKESFLGAIDVELIKKNKPKIVIDYAFGSASTIFPSILGKLNCEAISLNAYMDENKLTKTEKEFKESLFQLSTIVATIHADVGFMLDAGAEKIFLVDEKGNIISGDNVLALFSMLVMKSKHKSCIAVPVSASRAIDEIAKIYNGVVYRTKTTYRSMMEIALSGKVSFVGEGKGGYIFPEFQPALDAMMSVIKLLELLIKCNMKLSDVINEIPKTSIVKEHVYCPWEKKGTVMRNLIEHTKSNKVELIDGVKIFNKDNWVIVIPDAAKALFHINAEANNEKSARKLIDKFVELIKEWQK